MPIEPRLFTGGIVLDSMHADVMLLASWVWRRRLAQRPETDLGVDAATLLGAARRPVRHVRMA